MGRKKRPAAAATTNNNVAIQQQQQFLGRGPPLPPGPPMAPTSFDQYGRPIMPPPPPPMMPPVPPPQQQQQQQQQQDQPNNNKRARTSQDDTTNNEEQQGERTVFPVKKYRSDSYYRSIEAFQRYTKSHRMLDASYVKWTTSGATPDKPIVFGIRIAGSFLSWGRGKTRDAAIDAAIRAAFALVAAHGYDDFTLNEDCFTEEPFDVPVVAAMPPPPPPPPMLPPGAAPPLPPGLPPNFAGPPGMAPPNFAAPPPMEMIPQPVAPKTDLAVASTVVEGATTVSKIGLAPSAKTSVGTSNTATNDDTKKKGSSLVFSGDGVDEQGQELSMEEMRLIWFLRR